MIRNALGTILMQAGMFYQWRRLGQVPAAISL